MASTKSATKLSGILASLSETLTEFRTESAEIESSFFELVDEIAELGPPPAAAGAPAATVAIDATELEAKALESVAVERLETLDRSLAEQRAEFSGKQDRLADDVGQLRELVDRQVQLFVTLINSTTKLKNSNASRKRSRKKSPEDEVLDEVFEQFEKLRGAATAGCTVSAT